MNLKALFDALASLLNTNPLNPPMAAGVRRMGFRKWYERELLSGHAHMVLALFCAIAIMAGMEVFRGASLGEKLGDALMVVLSAVIGVWAVRRYLYLLMHAENAANQANCPHCQSYGLFEVLSESHRGSVMRVRCRRCAHEWTIEDV